MAKHKKTDRDEWEKRADLTPAHKRGGMAKEQVKAEGRKFASRQQRSEDDEPVETAQAKPEAETAAKKPSKRSTKRKKK